MLRIEVDIMSGRPNPEWIITNSDATLDVLRAVADAPAVAAKIGAGYAGLGYRELRVSIIEDDPKRPRGVPRAFALASTASEDLPGSGAIAKRLIRDMTRYAEVRLVAHEFTPLNSRIRDGILQRLARFLADPPLVVLPKPPPGANPLRTTIKDERCQECEYEVSQFNPAFWNAPTVQPHNNCYNYGRNWRTDTFAQPGRAHGAQTSTMSCGAVTTAAMADGLVKRCTCLPISEYPRRLMALVIDPGWDYHWYRHQRGGFWGHKPGGTAARNVDSNNAVIVNPETCARGGYTDFCDYFYAGRSVVIN
ncbi:MAG: hypothetical protein M3546_11770 [Actinomycetota bacterium]|nr:hypothetical protein [Actinomycetota bacterium]